MINPADHFRFAVSNNPDGTFHADCEIPRELPYFDGHFPENPVFPAFGFLDASAELLKTVRPSARPCRVDRAKFMKPIVPGARIRIVATPRAPHTFHCRWKNLDSDESYAELTITLYEAPASISPTSV